MLHHSEVKGDGWNRWRYGESMEYLGFWNYLCAFTLFGDWSCELFSGTDRKIWHPVNQERGIGDFSADAAQVGVFLLQEVHQYNPA